MSTESMKMHEEMDRDEKFSLLKQLQCTYFFSKDSKEVFSVLGVLHSLNMLTTMVDSQVFCIITGQHPLSASKGHADQQLWLGESRWWV